jgi:hypothetical protein
MSDDTFRDYGRTLPQVAHALAVHDMYVPGCRACGVAVPLDEARLLRALEAWDTPEASTRVNWSEAVPYIAKAYRGES